MDHIKAVQKAIAFIHEQYNDAITVVDIAGQVYGIAPAQFHRSDHQVNLFPPETLFTERSILVDLKKVFEKVQFVKKDAFYVIGIETDINYNTVPCNPVLQAARWPSSPSHLKVFYFHIHWERQLLKFLLKFVTL